MLHSVFRLVQISRTDFGGKLCGVGKTEGETSSHYYWFILYSETKENMPK
jgi:hypothetical protein